MSFAAAFVLAVQPLPAVGGEAAPMPRVIAVRGTASAEILRVGRVGPEAGPDEVRPQLRRSAAGGVIAEFR